MLDYSTVTGKSTSFIKQR